jgi:hypothetical protein
MPTHHHIGQFGRLGDVHGRSGVHKSFAKRRGFERRLEPENVARRKPATDPQETFVPRQRMVGPARKRSFAPDRRPCSRQDHVSSSSSAFTSFRSPVSKPSVKQP